MNVYLPCDWIAQRMNLQWSGTEGYYKGPSDELVALDPTAHARGPRALLIKKDALIEFLDENDLAILWTLLGEKNVLGGRMSGEAWKGRLEISGAHVTVGGDVDGVTKVRFAGRGG